MGWRNIAFSCLDDAEAQIKKAREALQSRGPLEPFVGALLNAVESLNQATQEAVNDGVLALTATRKV
jgi:hypothetical protein